MCPSSFRQSLKKIFSQPLVVCLLATSLLSASSHAGHYFLKDLNDVVPAKYHAALERQGITNSKQLYEAAAPSRARRTLARKTRVSKKLLRQWATFIDLMQINGIGPKMVRLLNGAGVPNLKQFKKSDPVQLVEKMRLANRGAKYSEIIPGVAVVKAWLKQARTIESKLQ